MIVLALVVGGLTGWYLGVRAGVLAASISAVGLLIAMFVPGTALPVYAALALWCGALYVIKTKLPGLVKQREPEKKGWEKELDRWKKRASWLWKARK